MLDLEDLVEEAAVVVVVLLVVGLKDEVVEAVYLPVY